MFLNEYFSKLWALENLTLQSFWSLVTIHIPLTFHQVLFFVLIYLYILFQELLVTVLSPASKELGQWRFRTFFKNFEVCWVLPLLFSFHSHWWLTFIQILVYNLLSLSATSVLTSTFWLQHPFSNFFFSRPGSQVLAGATSWEHTVSTVAIFYI